MRRRYQDCIREDGLCASCSLTSYGRDCHNNPINAITFRRQALGLTQAQLAEMVGVQYRWVQKLERGECDVANITLRLGLALAKALEMDPEELLRCSAGGA